MRKRLLTLASGLALALAPAIASAQAENPPANPPANPSASPYGGDKYGQPAEKQPVGGQVEEPPEDVKVTVTEEPPPPEHRHTLPVGVGLSAGGGISSFVGDGIANYTSDIGGEWEARVTFGTKSLLALEAAYVGTATSIDALGLDADALLMSNGVEALARLNIGAWQFQPFLFAGISWARYDIVNNSGVNFDINDSDDVFMVPLGAGLATYIGASQRFMMDLRFSYRFAFDDEILVTGDQNMDNWSASLRIGYQF